MFIEELIETLDEIIDAYKMKSKMEK